MEENEKEIVLKCRSKKRSNLCPKCGEKCTTIYDTWRKPKRIKHAVLHGKVIIIEVCKRRFLCKKCQKPFREKLESVEGKERHSTQFKEDVRKNLKGSDFTSVAQQMGTNPMMVRRTLDEIDPNRISLPKSEEICLGIDGTYLADEKEVMVIGDPKQRKFITVLEDASKEKLVNFLKNEIKPKKKVTAASIDMSKLLRAAIREVFPDTPIVADPFHVVKFTNSVIDKARIAIEKETGKKYEIKRILVMKKEKADEIKASGNKKWKLKRERMERAFIECPDIKTLWDIKNMLHEVYKSKTHAVASKRLSALIQFCFDHTGAIPELQELLTMLNNWRIEILNFFIFRISNGYIEGINNKIELIKRRHYGLRDIDMALKRIFLAFLPLTFLFPEVYPVHTFY